MKNFLKNHSILYVEDEPGTQKQMTEYLEEYFKEVYVASDGKQGLEKYQEYHPDALLLDIDLPYIDGLTLAKSIRKTDRSVSIIMLTAFTDQEKLLRATELKLLKYLVKPIKISAFKETLDLLAAELAGSTKDVLILSEGYTWHKSEQKLCHRGKSLGLTVKEGKLLALLAKNQHSSISFEDIMAHVWEDEFDREVSVNCVKNIVSDLRKKLPLNAIQSVYGKGYMLH